MPKKYNKDSWGLTFIHFHDKGYAEDKVKAGSQTSIYKKCVIGLCTTIRRNNLRHIHEGEGTQGATPHAIIRVTPSLQRKGSGGGKYTI